MFTKQENMEVLKPHLKTPVIVEGKRDVINLKRLNFNNIISLNGDSLYNLSEKISEKYNEVIILTDFDKEGNRLARKLNLFLENLGVKVNKKARKEIKKTFKGQGILEIESF